MPLLKKMRRSTVIVMFLVLIVTVVLIGDYLFRCYGKPLSREEALQRVTAQLKSLSHDLNFGESLPPLVKEQYDPGRKTWWFTFKNEVCEIDIITDRCEGTDVGGTTCQIRR
jgi:hypothetical protein